ncbi:MAG: hypothetical protein IPN68_08965 [Bacteroidetes bacterium]|nr:hypothetical protein [Bacteroidota bacterium]
MNKSNIINTILILSVFLILVHSCGKKLEPDKVLNIGYPYPDALFRLVPSPSFDWWSQKPDKNISYDVNLYTENNKLSFTATVNNPNWTPGESARG